MGQMKCPQVLAEEVQLRIPPEKNLEEQIARWLNEKNCKSYVKPNTNTNKFDWHKEMDYPK